jgi:mediator of RNA polymerase II transcription subunit 13
MDGSEVIITPGGFSAMAVADDAATDSANVRQWKALVQTRLRSRGIDVLKLDPEDHWLLLRMQGQNLLPEPADCLTFYWPSVLCFVKGPSKTPSEVSLDVGNVTPLWPPQVPNNLYWFEPPGRNGFMNPLRFAANWYDGKAGRDKVIEERRKRIEAMKKQTENSSLTATSPSYTRDGLQATTGVYPTPPDGILSQVSQALAAQDVNALSLPTDQNAHRTSLDMQHSEMMDLDIGPFEDNVRQRPSVISRGSLDGVIKMGSEDFFGDLEDEDLRGQDITDADFSFFDEPEVPDAVMLDGGIDNATDPVKKEETNASAGQHDNEPRVDIQQSPPRVASDTSKDRTSTQDTKHAHTELLSAVEEVKDTPMNGTDMPSEKEDIVHEPLSPTSIRKKLFDFAITSPGNERRASQFQPLAFNTMLQQHDAKYSLNGTFGFKIQTPLPADKLSATSPHIQPRPLNEKGRRLSLRPRLSVTSPSHAGLYDSESSSDISDSSDEDSAYQNGFRSFVPSPVKGKFQDGNGSMGEDVQSIPGANSAIQQDFVLDANVSATTANAG